MSAFTSESTSIGDFLVVNFLSAWNGASLLFTEMKQSDELYNVFNLAQKLCKSNTPSVQNELSTNEIRLDEIIERNNSNYNAKKELQCLGDDIAELILLIHNK
jgi:hypothetical protein